MLNQFFFSFYHQIPIKFLCRPKTEKAVVKATINLKAEAKTQHALSNMTFAFVFLWVLTMWYVVNERAKERSGRHKKNDSEHIMFESNI